jgi:tRNA pseudouridine32 synthase / 23S rRNA pseudouridine746 synthase
MVQYPMEKFVLKKTIGSSNAGKVTDYLAAETGLSRGRVKEAMNKGAVWVGREKGVMRRLRKATAVLHTGIRIEFHYDEKLLVIVPPQARLLEDRKDYSVWHKPVGLMAQGTMYGDHCSLLRQAEIYFGTSRESFLVHRLDREAEGLMLIAHTKKAAAELSEIFRNNLIIKKYRVEVLGNLTEKCSKGTIDLPLDGKAAITEYEVESYDPSKNTSIVDVTIKTGRLHQIRRHFDMIGFPVMGDPKYGKGNKNTEGMKLVAYSLKFKCPFSKREVEYNIQNTY